MQSCSSELILNSVRGQVYSVVRLSQLNGAVGGVSSHDFRCAQWLHCFDEWPFIG
jgi:hypothetical protein